MNTGKQMPIGVLLQIFGELDEDSDTVVESCRCSQALLNEGTGMYGCRLLEGECPYDMPDPKRCRASGRFPAGYKMRIYVPKSITGNRPQGRTKRKLRHKQEG